VLTVGRDIPRVTWGTLWKLVGNEDVGWLLLGTNSHSPTGLMRADWRTKDLIDMAQGGLGFSEDQAQTMKAKLWTFASRKESSLVRPSAGR